MNLCAGTELPRMVIDTIQNWMRDMHLVSRNNLNFCTSSGEAFEIQEVVYACRTTVTFKAWD